MHTSADWWRADFGTLCLVGSYLDASIEESQLILSAVGVWPQHGRPRTLFRQQWDLLAAMRSLRNALGVSWEELATAWLDRAPTAPGSTGCADRRVDLDPATTVAGSGEDVVANLARSLHAEPCALAALIDGHRLFLGVDLVPLALDDGATTFRTVRHLWWLKTRLGVSVDEFLALECCLQSDAPAAKLFLPEDPRPLLWAARLVRWSRRLAVPLRDLLAMVGREASY